MPEFTTPFLGSTHDCKLNPEELIRAIGSLVAAEYQAVQLCMQLAESINNKAAKEVPKDIADEEKFYQEGTAEVEEIIKKLKKK
jgi:rubrerythrin